MTAFGPHADLTLISACLKPGADPHRAIKVRAGRRWTERIVPPAGEAYAFDVERWPVEVEVTVSPGGRVVRLHVNGTEVDVRPLRRRRLRRG